MEFILCVSFETQLLLCHWSLTIGHQVTICSELSICQIHQVTWLGGPAATYYQLEGVHLGWGRRSYTNR